MTRVKNFEATGVAPLGRLYAGDLLAIQDHYADLQNFSQVVGVGTLQIGDTSLMLVKYGTGEFRMTGAVRTDGILRALGGLYAGSFTTAQRDAIAAGLAPYGLIILNTTLNRFQWNTGTDGARVWADLSGDLANMPSAGQKAALAGTAGTPSDTNRYVTNDGLTGIIGGGVITVGSPAGGDLAGTYPNPTVAKSSKDFALAGVITPTALSANANDYAPTNFNIANFVRLSSTVNVKITGMSPNGVLGRLVTVHNIGSFKINLATEDTGSTGANRFAFGADITLNAGDACILHYDTTSARWRCIGVPPSVVIPPSPMSIASFYGTDPIQPSGNNSAILYPFLVSQHFNVAFIAARVKTGVGNLDLGIYTRAGIRVVSSGSFPSPNDFTNFKQAVTLTGVDPGSFWLAFGVSNGSHRWDGQIGPSQFLGRTVTAAFPLPASITIPATTPTGIPSFEIIPG